MPSCKPCIKAGLKGETSNELTAGCGFEFNRVHNEPSNRPPLRSNMKLIELARSNRGNMVYIIKKINGVTQVCTLALNNEFTLSCPQAKLIFIIHNSPNLHLK